MLMYARTSLWTVSIMLQDTNCTNTTLHLYPRSHTANIQKTAFSKPNMQIANITRRNTHNYRDTSETATCSAGESSANCIVLIGVLNTDSKPESNRYYSRLDDDRLRPIR
uniref:Uncharacterized protein n=1 Tax=Cacopsylla melanoneura TaxID=428564 RepID=A0A8D8TGZ1_9HEMI